jgi:5-methyltetrahydropteroyltriglutamate--homocysteine methyltransferase
MQGNPNRILTTHVGSLPRTVDVLDAMKAKIGGEAGHDEAAYQRKIRDGVRDIVKRQIDVGIDVVADGEMSKPGFFSYIEERMEGFDPRPDEKYNLFAAETAAFPEYYADYFARMMLGGAVVPMYPMYCVGPVRYKGEDALARDLDNLRAALEGRECEGAFVPAVAPAGVGYNEYYATEEEYAEAVAEAMRVEYLAIVDAGFVLQIDDPFLCDILVDPALDDSAKDRKARTYVEAINHAVRGIDADKIRFHTCYGINEGPRINEAPMADVARYMLDIDAGSYSFEAANPRHEHEYHIWEDLKLADGKALIPGVITHASNIVEHPELIAERLVRFAKRVGRENVLAGGDCGFSSQACYHTEVHPTVIWAKFEAMTEGARLATEALW